MKVLKPGALHELVFVGPDFNNRYLFVLLDCLTKLDEGAGALSEGKVQQAGRLEFCRIDTLQALPAEIIEAIEVQAPPGIYFGLPRAHRTCIGFWPRRWHESMFDRPTETDVRRMGSCLIGQLQTVADQL